MKITYKGLEITAMLNKDNQEGFEDEIRFVHVTTGQECEMFDQVFAGWSEQNEEDNKNIDAMKELFRLNNEDIYLHLFDELDVDLERYAK